MCGLSGCRSQFPECGRLRLREPNLLLSPSHRTLTRLSAETPCPEDPGSLWCLCRGKVWVPARSSFLLPTSVVLTLHRDQICMGKKEDEELVFLSHISWDHWTHFWWGSATGTLQNRASLPYSYKINNGVRVPSAKTFLSPPTCIFLTAEEDGELLLIVPRLTPLGPWRKGALSSTLSLWMGLCLWKFLPL